MDFIPKPFGAVDETSIQVPFLAEDRHEYVPTGRLRDFEAFGQEIGAYLSSTDVVQNLPQSELASRFQSWLYFGLLSALLGKSIDQRSYRKEDSMVDSARVAFAIQLIHEAWSAQAGPRLDFLNTRAHGLFGFAKKQMDRLSYILHGNMQRPLVTICLSICTMISILDCEAFNNHRYLNMDSSTARLAPKVVRTGEQIPPWSLMMLNLFEMSGWCPLQAYRIIQWVPLSAAYFLARLPRMKRNHKQCLAARKCLGWDSSRVPNGANHVDSTCQCELLSVPTEKITSIIENGAIPLVQLREDRDGELRFKVTRRTRLTYYIAISHVWADGLNNKTSNGLPRCQAVRLFHDLGMQVKRSDLLERPLKSLLPWNQNYVVDRSSVKVWMDTLCIPSLGSLDPEHPSVRAKNMAIERMNDIYANAQATLVLDAELQAIPHVLDDPIVHISFQAVEAFCGWSTRSWTLQEQALSLKLRYAATNGLHSDLDRSNYIRGGTMRVIRAQVRAISKARHTTIWTPPKLNAIENFFLSYLVQDRQSQERTFRDEFSATWNALIQRTSTFQSDDLIILANLTRLSPIHITRLANDNERLQAIVKNVSLLPIDMLFINIPRMHASSGSTDVKTLRTKAYSRRGRQASLASTAPSQDLEMVNLLGNEHTTASFRPFTNRWVPSARTTGLSPAFRQCLKDGSCETWSFHMYNQHGRLSLPLHDVNGPLAITVMGMPFQRESLCHVVIEKHHVMLRVQRTLPVLNFDVACAEANGCREYCILLDNAIPAEFSEGRRLRGAGLYVLGDEDHRSVMMAREVTACIYDCPLNVEVLRDTSSAHEETYEGRIVKHEIHILYDAEELGPTLPKPQHRGGFLGAFIISLLLTFVVGFTSTSTFTTPEKYPPYVAKAFHDATHAVTTVFVVVYFCHLLAIFPILWIKYRLERRRFLEQFDSLHAAHHSKVKIVWQRISSYALRLLTSSMGLLIMHSPFLLAYTVIFLIYFRVKPSIASQASI